MWACLECSCRFDCRVGGFALQSSIAGGMADGAQVQFVAQAVTGVRERGWSLYPLCAFLLALAFLSQSINWVSFLVLYFYSETQPQLRKAGLDRDNVILCLAGPGVKAKGSLISLIVMEYCPLHSSKRAAFVS